MTPKIGEPIPGTNLKYEEADIINLQSNTPTSFKEETPAGTLPSSGSDLSNLTKALRSALGEASQQQSASRMTQLSGLVEGGAAPSVINAAIGLAQSGLRQRQQDIFSDTISGYTETQKLAEIKKQSAFNMINTMMDNGVFLDTPAGTLLAWEKEAGLPEGTSLSWQAGLKIAKDKSDEEYELKMKEIRQRIADAGAPSNLSGVNASLQKYIDKGATPDEAARLVAADFADQGINIKLEDINRWTERASKLTKAPVAPPPPEPTPKTAYERGQAAGTTLEYFPGALKETVIDKPLGVAQSVGSFFSGLFGQ